MPVTIALEQFEDLLHIPSQLPPPPAEPRDHLSELPPEEPRGHPSELPLPGEPSELSAPPADPRDQPQ